MSVRRRNKYGAVKTVVDNVKFDSKAEARRWMELRLMERDGEIVGLQRQIPFDLAVNGRLICRYVADYAYTVVRSGERIVEDCKSPATMTPAFRLKAKLMEAVHGIVVQVWTGRRQSAQGVAKGQSWLRTAAKRTRKTSSRGGG